jgi:predicted transposase/invertase (TIGR01784 family)
MMEIEKDEGYNEGKKESQIEIAKKMLKDKMSIDIISKYTSLSKEEIENIINNK